MATILEYLNDTYLFECDAVVVGVGENEKGKFIVLDRTIFYPKGGGQPSDHGWLQVTAEEEKLPVHLALLDAATNRVLHYVEGIIPECVVEGIAVSMKIDEDRRRSHAIAHTCGHILSDVVNEVAPELTGKIGAHDPKDGCYVKFQGLLSTISPDILQATVNDRVKLLLLDNRSVTATIADEGGDGGKPYRLVQVDGFLPSPCGGTHVKSLDVITSLTITKVSAVKKENMTKVSYACS